MTDSSSSPSRLRGFALHVLPALLYVGLIFYGGSLTAAKMPRVDVSDKLVHLLAFAILELLAFRAARFEWPRKRLKWQVLTSMIATSAIGGALEIYQLFIKYRSAELLDWVADSVGALAVGTLLFLVLRGTEEAGRAGALPQRDSTSTAG